MAGKLPENLYQETQIGQVLLQGKVIAGDDAAKKVEDVAEAQKTQPAGSRKLIGQMLVDAGLVNGKDIDAALDVQKTVRTELGQLIDKGESPDAKKVGDLVNDSYKAYEQAHPDYHRPSPDQHATLEIPRQITERVAAKETNPRAYEMAAGTLAANLANHEVKLKTEAPERLTK